MAGVAPGAGPYSIVEPRDLDAQRNWIRSEVAAVDLPDEVDVPRLDRMIDSRCYQWQQKVDDQYRRRKALLLGEIDRFRPTLSAANQRVELASLDFSDASRVREDEMARARGVQSSGPGKEIQLSGEARARRKADPGQSWVPGFDWGLALYAVVMVIAAAADVAGFYQVLALLLRSWPWVLAMMVLMASIGSLFAMHMAGRELRQFKEHGRLWIAVATIAGWVVLGAIAFTVRLRVQEDSSASTGFFGGLAGPSSFSESQSWVKATAFLAIYLISGLVAIIGGYATHNEVRARVAKAVRAQRRAGGRLSKETKRRGVPLSRIEGLYRQVADERDRWANAQVERLAFADELLAIACNEIAKTSDDPELRDRILKAGAPLFRIKNKNFSEARKVYLEQDEKDTKIPTRDELERFGLATGTPAVPAQSQVSVSEVVP